MRPRIIAITLLLVLLIVLPSLADPAPVRQAGTQQASWMETDPKTGAIRFFVNGQEQARIDATGLHVRESIDYEGTLTDGGIYPVEQPAPKSKGKP